MKSLRNILVLSFIIALLLACPDFAFSQDKGKSDKTEVIDGKKYYLHTVAKGQTLYYISKLYDVSLDDIKKHNPELSKGLIAGQVLKIPADKSTAVNTDNKNQTTSDKAKTSPKIIEHTVVSGESVWTIAQKYNTTEKAVLRDNPDAAKGLKPGQKLKITLGETASAPSAENVQNVASKTEKQPQYQTYKVSSGETLFGIAKKFGTTVDEIKKLNPGIEQNFKPGNEIKLPANVVVKPEEGKNAQTAASKKEPARKTTIHTVKTGETLYQISKIYGVSIQDIQKDNPGSENGISIGQELKISVPISEEEQAKSAEPTNIIEYTVQQGENLYRIARNHNTYPEDIIKLNPEAASGLQPGQVLKIAVPQTAALPQPKINENTEYDTIYHPVKKQETLFGISRLYGKTVDDLLALNPSAIDGLKEGQNLAIEVRRKPKKISKPVVSNSLNITDCGNAAKKAEYNIGLMLPFNASTLALEKLFKEDEDSPDNELSNTAQKSLTFFDFYQGFLVATDSVRKLGMNMKIFVYDTQRDSSTTPSLMKKNEVQNLDMLIGPVFPADQNIVASAFKDKNIPIIFPLTAYTNITDNPNVIDLVPNPDIQLKRVAEYITQKFSGCNLFIVHNEKESELKNADILKSVFKSSGMKYQEVFYNKSGFTAIENQLSNDTNNIVFLLTAEQVFASNFIRKLSSQTENFRITLFALPQITRFANIENEYLCNLNLHVYSHVFIDYDNNIVKRFIRLYRDKYSTEPSKFSFQGFSVGVEFLSALYRYGASLNDCLPKIKFNSIHSEYKFEKNNLGFYENQYINIYRYSNYTLIKVN